MRNDLRKRLRGAAAQIAANRNETSYTSLTAFRKLFVQERRDWSQPHAPRTGWKRGEIFEVIQACSAQERAEEWGDVGYYVAQSFVPLWWMYCLITPQRVILSACAKFEARTSL